MEDPRAILSETDQVLVESAIDILMQVFKKDPEDRARVEKIRERLETILNELEDIPNFAESTDYEVHAKASSALDSAINELWLIWQELGGV